MKRKDEVPLLLKKMTFFVLKVKFNFNSHAHIVAVYGVLVE